VEDQPAVVGSHEAANRTGSLEAAYNETASITGTLDPDVILDPLVTTDDLLDTSSYAPEAEYPQQAGEEDHTISIGSAAGSDQLGTRSLEPVSVEQLSPYPTSTVLTTRFGSPGTPPLRRSQTNTFEKKV
jgi:hypothetical protein